MALLMQYRVPCDNFEQYARSRVRVAGLAAGWGADDCRHRPGGSVGNVGGRHEIAMMKNRYSKETGHYHWRCCVASDDVEGQGSSSGGRGGEGREDAQEHALGFCAVSGVNQKSLLLPKNREGKVG